MNYLIFILIVAIFFGITDFFTERFPRLQREIYYIAFGILAFLCTIKYYFGPDIAAYVPYYEELPSMATIWEHPDYVLYDFELGFSLFCRVLKDFGVSFYWMTAIISVLYFTVVALLFRKIENKRSFALAILMVLDYNIILFEYRQCLSVVAFLLMVMCLSNRRFIIAMLCAVMSIGFHKAGAMVVLPTLLFYVITYNQTMRPFFTILMTLLVIMFLLPVTHLSVGFLNTIPLPSSMVDSIMHHLTVGKQVQSVFIVYALVFVCLIHFSRNTDSRVGFMTGAALMGMLFIVILYQYYYLLNRIRSYFTPLLIVYIFNYIQTAEKGPTPIPYGKLIKQLTCFVLMLYMLHIPFALYRSEKRVHNHVNDTCTLFDLTGNATKEEIQRSQLKRAEKFWDEDFMQTEENLIQR